MKRIIYGDGTHTVEVNDETRVVTITDEATEGIVEMSERAFGEVAIGWHRWRENLAVGIPEQVATPAGIESAEESGTAG